MRLAVTSRMLRNMARVGVLMTIACLLGGCLIPKETDNGGWTLTSPPDCGDLSHETPGELGKLSFAYDVGAIVCAFGCSAESPIAERSVVQIVVHTNIDLPPV